MRNGASVQDAVDNVLSENLEADAGFIAVDHRGGMYSRNSDRVARRPDIGHARLSDARSGAVVEVLHNAIRPRAVLAPVAAAVALEAMLGTEPPAGWATVHAGTKVVLGPMNALRCDENLIATECVTTDPLIVHGHHVCAAIYLHSVVYRGEQRIGVTTVEPITTVENGRITQLSGQKSVRLSYTASM
jgi:hypothetical protein